MCTQEIGGKCIFFQQQQEKKSRDKFDYRKCWDRKVNLIKNSQGGMRIHHYSKANLLTLDPLSPTFPPEVSFNSPMVPTRNSQRGNDPPKQQYDLLPFRLNKTGLSRVV